MTLLDRAVLQAFADQVMTPAVMEDAVDQALALLAAERSDDGRHALRERLTTIETQIERLMAAIEAGAEVAALIDRLHDREAERCGVTRELATLDAAPSLPNRAALRRTLLAMQDG